MGLRPDLSDPSTPHGEIGAPAQFPPNLPGREVSNHMIGAQYTDGVNTQTTGMG